MKRSAIQRKTPLARVAFKEPKTEGKPKPPRTRRCALKECRAQFVPEKPFQTWCGPEHGAVIAQAKLAKQKQAQVAATKRAKKAEGVRDREKAEAMKTLPQLLKEAQREFNRFIRLRDHDKPCICCGRLSTKTHITGSSWDCGHWRSVGSAPHLRFTEDNAHRQLVYCNQFKSGNAIGYRAGLIKRIGLERVEALESNNEVHKWTHDEVRGIRDTYRQKANQLEKDLKNA